MARFGACLLLAVLAVFPLASLGRPTAALDFRTVDSTEARSEVAAYGPWGSIEESRDARSEAVTEARSEVAAYGPWGSIEESPYGPPPEAVAYGPWGSIEESRDGEEIDQRLYFRLESKFRPSGTRLCADIDGSNVVMRTCRAGKTSQKWFMDGPFIKHSSGNCLDVCNGPACHQYDPPLVQVILFPCNSGTNQQFFTSGSTIVSQFNSNCLDVCNSDLCRPRFDVITFPCHGGSNQQWIFRPADDGGPQLELTME